MIIMLTMKVIVTLLLMMILFVVLVVSLRGNQEKTDHHCNGRSHGRGRTGRRPGHTSIVVLVLVLVLVLELVPVLVLELVLGGAGAGTGAGAGVGAGGGAGAGAGGASGGGAGGTWCFRKAIPGTAFGSQMHSDIWYTDRFRTHMDNSQDNGNRQLLFFARECCQSGERSRDFARSLAGSSDLAQRR